MKAPTYRPALEENWLLKREAAMSESRPPDDTPPQKRCDHKFIDSVECVKCGWTPAPEQIADSGKGMGKTAKDVKPPVAPDDTPTRPRGEDIREAIDGLTWAECRDEAVRVSIELGHVQRDQDFARAWRTRIADQLQVPLPQAEGKVWEAIEQRLAEVSRLQQENALLKRSLDMLVKQTSSVIDPEWGGHASGAR
jgi:hypothetical protein